MLHDKVATAGQEGHVEEYHLEKYFFITSADLGCVLKGLCHRTDGLLLSYPKLENMLQKQKRWITNSHRNLDAGRFKF